ncbi:MULTISPECIES: restriction endonuclease subunit S [unclassified Pseudomonas]|uniref:restriction endonuclease subunit S n=1 Tax=unclassified Pseudomonas TaxID=196821 RepID=UPI00048F8361|nr:MULTISPECIES: restriction endonuclease subunit S [unclassified Pseudomonas]MEC4242350.1 restriction endonuclease subunit S [Pseudomonas sp. DSV-1]
MTALLTENLPLLAGAPNGIKKLRELILELAVRGKLVPQDPSDEPASELLKRIVEEKARLVAEGKIKKGKTVDDAVAEISYPIPSTWDVASLGQVVEIVRGITFPANEKSREPEHGRVACLRTANVQNEIEWDDLLYIRESFISRPDQYVQPYDIVMSMANSRELVGKVAMIGSTLDQPTTFGGFLGVLRPVLIEPRFVMALLRTPHARSALIDSASQTTNIANVSLAKLRPLLFAIPPLAEQYRIVAKVDELMALCDRLEAQQADAESAHTQLVQALLDSLTQACDADDFATNWQRLAEHFHALFTTEPSIVALKQTLLQLAVMGKLVPQDPSDEPASELLKRIVEEKARLVAEGKIKRQKAQAEIVEEEKPFVLPEKWTWVRLGEILSLTSGKGFKAQEYSLSGARLFQIANVSLGHTKWQIENFLPENYLNDYPELALKEGDVLIALNRPLLNGRMKVCIISEKDLPAILYQRVGRFNFYDSSVEAKFFYYYLQSHLFIGKLNESLQGSDQPFINQSQVVEFLFSWPPLAEQHRIVNKVDQLMALCDQLEIRLSQARELNEQLASTLVEQAVA